MRVSVHSRRNKQAESVEGRTAEAVEAVFFEAAFLGDLLVNGIAGDMKRYGTVK